MKKPMSKKKNALLVAAVVSGLAFSQPVDAANLGAFVASDYSQSQLGTIQGSYIDSADISAAAGTLVDLNRDPAIYNTVDQTTGKSEMYIRQYNYSTTNLVPSYAFNGQGDFSDAVSGTPEGACNAHGVARSDNFVYTASYDEGTIGVGLVSDTAITQQTEMTVDLKQDLINLEGISFSDTCQLHGEAVTIDGNNLYVVANVNPGGDAWDPSAAYDPSYLMQYIIQPDGSLTYNSAVTMGKNTDSVRLNKYNNMIITSAIGGYQNYGDDVANEETSLDIAFLDADGTLTSSKKVTVPDNVSREMRSIKVLPNGTAYVMCYNIANYGSAINLDVYKTTVSNLVSDTPNNWEKVYEAEGAEGWFGKLDAEYDTNRLWVQVGNELKIFTDGETDPVTFGAADFTTNPAYNQLYTWDTIKTDQVAGELAKLRDSSIVSNTAVLWKDNPHSDMPLTDDWHDLGTEEITVTVTDESQYANLDNNIMAGMYGNEYMFVNGGVLNVQVENNVATPVGIYVGPGANFEGINAEKLNIIVKSPENGNSLTNAVWIDAPSEENNGSGTLVSINTPVNIRVEGGMGGNGIAIAKTDRWGEDSKESWGLTSALRIMGDVSIKGETNQDWGIGLRKDNVISRYNNTGIITKVNDSEIIVDGDVDLDVYGNGIATVADRSKIIVTGGGQITVPKGTDYGYYALASYGGEVLMNFDETGKHTNGNDVNIDGDIFVVKKDNAKDASVSLALTTANSYLNGIIDNGSRAKLYLQNGAVWTNEANNTRYYQDNEDIGSGQMSRVTNFYGGSSKDAMGIINQTAKSKDLTIDNYRGHTMVTYTHNAQTPTNILGGDTKITKAAADSSITLRTDSDGIDMTIDESVEAVLDALAHKLYYSSYVSGERNLDGYVQIAEGLTTASVAKAVGDIEFNETNGQGSLKTGSTGGNEGSGSEGEGGEGTEPTPPTPTIPDSQEQDTFTTPIRGLNEEVYINAGVLKDGVYEFTMDKTTLNVDKSEIAGGPWLGNIGSAVSASGVGTKTVIDLNGNDFEVNATHSSNHSTGITAINDGIVEINNPGDITVTATGGGQTAAIFANGSGEIHIHNGEGGTVIARADAANAANGAVIKTMNGKAGESKIIIDGMVDVVADAENGANEAISAVASRIEIGGGNIEAKNGAWAAIRAYGEFQTQNAGIVNINVTKDADGNITGAGDRKTTIKGDFVTNGGMGSKGQISVGLKGEESFWEGKYTDNVGYGVTPGQLGSVNLWIEDGAHWTGYSSGSVNLNLSGDGSYWDGYSTNNKMLLSLKNGATWKNSNASQTSLIGNFIGDGGSIDMTGGVTIDKYSGNTMVLYKHDAETPTNIIGGDITIKSAAEDSSITLRTDSDGIDLGSRDSVEGTLDALAHKLYYTGYVDGERNLTGSVEIAEGLTTSSVKKVYGSIGYSDTNGQGSLDGGAQGFAPSSQEQDTFTTPIRGLNEEVYINAGVLKDGVYEFTMDKTTLNVDKSEIAGGPWLGNIGSAVSASGVGTKTVIDLNGNDFEVNATHSSNHSTGITAINDGIVEINNPGDITVTATGGGQTAAIFANGSGEIHIHNGEGGTVIARADAASAPNGAVIKTMNGKAGESKIIIDGMVDVVADAENGANEAISAVASRIEIGGGNIEAKNGAWAAIRAYGEFMTQNSGIVNVNVTKDADGNITGAGDRKTTIKGDFVTNGGMGSKGQISVGLNGKDSFWEGNYTDNVGYGVTPGQLGSVNLWVEDGAHWKGFANGSVNLNLSGKDSYWYGFNTSEKMMLTLKDGAVWQNAITAEQTNGKGTIVDSRVGTFVGDGGFIDMTGAKVFTAIGNSLNGSSTSSANSAITESENGVTGNLVIDNYSGDTTVLYRHEVTAPVMTLADDDTTNTETTPQVNIIGGDITIKSAAEDSAITLRTDSDGIDLGSRDSVEGTLDALAHKLYYTGYVDGERNLTGSVEIAEGLTTSSVKKVYGNIGYSETDGQGSLDGYAEGVIQPDSQEKEEFTGAIGGANNDVAYGDEGVFKDDVYTFEKEQTTIKVNGNTIEGGNNVGTIGTAVSAVGGEKTTIDLKGNKLDVNAEHTASSMGIAAIDKGIVEINNSGDITVTANGDGRTAALFANEGGKIHIHNDGKDGGTVTVRANAGTNGTSAVIQTMNSGSVEGSEIIVDGMVDVVADATDGASEAVRAGSSRIELGGGNIEAKNGADIAIRAYSENNSQHQGIVNVNVVKDQDGKIIGAGERKTTIKGNFVTSDNVQAEGQINVGLSGKESHWHGNYIADADEKGSVNLFLDEGAQWKGTSTSSNMTLAMNDGAVWEHDNQIGVDSRIGTLVSDGGVLNMASGQSTAATYGLRTRGVVLLANMPNKLIVDNYSGDLMVNYEHDAAAPTTIFGDDIEIKSAAADSKITLRTDSTGIDLQNDTIVEGTLDALAHKLFYTGYTNGEDNLDGYVQIAEGLTTASLAKKVGSIDFSSTDGQGGLLAGSVKDVNNSGSGTGGGTTGGVSGGTTIYGDSETAMMRGAKSAMASAAMIWRTENDDMMQRTGDIRLDNNTAGLWAKYYGGKSEMDAQKAKFVNEYTAYQFGYDKKVKGGWTVGTAFSYNDGESTYELGGKGDVSVASLSFYGTRQSDDGRYLDLVVKGSRLDSDYTVYNDMRHKLEGDYDTWGASFSAEYGKRMERSNGFYFDPSVQLTVGHIHGADYAAASDFLDSNNKYKNMYVDQDSMNSVVGRIGFGIGQKTTKANYFAKVALAHEFAGDFSTTYRADGEAGGRTNIDFGGMWCELQVGGSMKLSSTSVLYATYERSFGGDVEQKYRIDAGMRFSF